MSMLRRLLWPAAIAADVFAGWVLGPTGCTCRPDTAPIGRP
jgi:hypothetical protein